MNRSYSSWNSIQGGHVERPETLDAITVNYKDVTVHVYGVVHGITGGANQSYVRLVNKTIRLAEGPRLCEKSMKMMYDGLDQDVFDWLQIPFKDSFGFGLSLTLNPRALWLIIRTMIREKAKSSQFGNKNVHIQGDLGGDALFHMLDPNQRRTLAGFPSPEDYLRLNLLRRKREDDRSLVFGDHNWEWLSYAEKYANIPMRSVHMIEYAVAWARREKQSVVSLFVGESHNTDIQWYVNCRNNNSLPAEFQEETDKAIKIAQAAVEGSILVDKIKYLSGATLAASTSALVYCLIAQVLFFMG